MNTLKKVADWLILPAIATPTALIMLHDGYPLWAAGLLLVLTNPIVLVTITIAEKVCDAYEDRKV